MSPFWWPESSKVHKSLANTGNPWSRGPHRDPGASQGLSSWDMLCPLYVVRYKNPIDGGSKNSKMLGTTSFRQSNKFLWNFRSVYSSGIFHICRNFKVSICIINLMLQSSVRKGTTIADESWLSEEVQVGRKGCWLVVEGGRGCVECPRLNAPSNLLALLVYQGKWPLNAPKRPRDLSPWLLRDDRATCALTDPESPCDLRSLTPRWTSLPCTTCNNLQSLTTLTRNS